MKKIYAFDFDGTLTTRDTLLLFIRQTKGWWGLLGCLLRYSPLLVLMKLHLYPNWRVKQKVFAHCFGGWSEERFANEGQQFAVSQQHLLRIAGKRCISQALAEGSKVVVISASIEQWVRPFFEFSQIHFLCTQVEIIEGRLTGRFLTANCYGQKKVDRLLECFPNRKDYHLVAFGDSRGDRELLHFADEAFYKPFRGKATEK